MENRSAAGRAGCLGQEGGEYASQGASRGRLRVALLPVPAVEVFVGADAGDNTPENRMHTPVQVQVPLGKHAPSRQVVLLVPPVTVALVF